MIKKIYKQPSLKVIELDGNAILAGSNEPSALNINEDVGEYGEDERPGVSRDIWGTQW